MLPLFLLLFFYRILCLYIVFYHMFVPNLFRALIGDNVRLKHAYYVLIVLNWR